MRFFLLMVVLVIVSCKPDTANNTEVDAKQNEVIATESSAKTTKKETNFNKAGIPDACDLLSTATISRYVNQPAENIFLMRE